MGQAVRRFEVVEGGSFGVMNCAPKEPTKEPLRNPDYWMGSDDLATLAGVSDRAARKAIQSRHWRGVALEVREEASNVGRGGKVLRVHVDSLPPDLREAWYLERGIALHEAPDPITGETVLVAEEKFERNARHERDLSIARWRHDVIRPALAHPKQSRQRRAELEKAASTPRLFPNGKTKTATRRTLENWVRAFEDGNAGVAGLMPKTREDKGQRKTVVTRGWDRFFHPHLKPGQAEALWGEMEIYIGSLWASGDRGWRVIRERATTRLIEMSRDLRVVAFDQLPLGQLGDRATAQTQFGICAVTRGRVEEFRDLRIGAIKRKDNATWQDKYAPSLVRTYDEYLPREIVVGDVHPVDIMCLRPDGTKVYPKAIAWLDVATNEIHMTFIMCEQREGVRREYVAMAFEAMVAEWGLPKLLYLDNGGEYSWDAMIAGFTELSKLSVGHFSVGDLECSAPVRERLTETKEAVIRSLPYNAKGKPGIEGAFGNIEQVLFATIPGWTSGDRMNKKTHAKGKDPIAFPGDERAFLAKAGKAIEHYNKRPQYGRLKGKSPNEALRGHIKNGWGKTVLSNPNVLPLAFSETIERVPDRGRFTYKPPRLETITFYCDELLGFDRQITVRVPAYRPEFAFCFDGETFLGMATPEKKYGLLDPAGATELSRRGKVLRRKVAQAERHVALLSLTDDTERHLEHFPDAPEAPVAATIDAGILERMSDLADRERQQTLAEANARKTARTAQQWKTGPVAALEHFEFAEEEHD